MKEPKPDFVFEGEPADAFSAKWSEQNKVNPQRLTQYVQGIISKANDKASKYGPRILAVGNVSSLPLEVKTRDLIKYIDEEVRRSGKPITAKLLLFRNGELHKL